MSMTTTATARAAENTPALLVISSGVCRCVIEPRGAHNLEGYDHGDTYRYEECRGHLGRYYRVYHQNNYYETCGPEVFGRYFVVEDGAGR